MGVEEYIGTVYKLDRIEYGDEFCNFMGYSHSKRKKFNCYEEVLKSHLSCFCPLYRYVIKSEGIFSVFVFKVDTNYHQFSWSNGFGHSRIEFRENILYCKQKGRKVIESWREYSPNGMIMTISCEGHTAKKYFIPSEHDDSCCDEDRCCVRMSKDKVNLV